MCACIPAVSAVYAHCVAGTQTASRVLYTNYLKTMFDYSKCMPSRTVLMGNENVFGYGPTAGGRAGGGRACVLVLGIMRRESRETKNKIIVNNNR